MMETIQTSPTGSASSIAKCDPLELLTSCGYLTSETISATTPVYGISPTFNDNTNEWECIGYRTADYEIAAYTNCCNLNSADINEEIYCRAISTSDIVTTPAPNTANGNVTAECNIDEELTDCSYSDVNGDSAGARPKYFDNTNDQCITTSGLSGSSIPQGRCCDLRGAAQLTCNSFSRTSTESAEAICDPTNFLNTDYFITGCSAIGNGSPIISQYISAVGGCNADTIGGNSVTAIALWYESIFYCHMHKPHNMSVYCIK